MLEGKLLPLKNRIERTFSSLKFLTLSSLSVISRAIPNTLFVNYVFWDGYLSYEFYKHQKLYPDQMLRFSRIMVGLAWFAGASSFLAGIYFIFDGIYSVVRYRLITRETKDLIEDLPRFGRVIAGIALIFVPTLFFFHI